MEDQPADSGDLTTDPAETAATRRRWRLLWRRAKAPETVSVSEVSGDDAEPGDPESADAAPTRRTPVGKSGRSAKPVAEPVVADEDTVADVEAGTADEPEAAPEPAAAPADTDEPADEATESAEPEPILVPHKPAGKRLQIAAAAAAALFVAAAAFAGATLQPYLSDRAAVDTKFDIARTAADAITTLWTYTPDDMEALPDRSARYLAGDFANEYRRYIDAIVATNKQAQVSNITEVRGTAVESLTPWEATAIVYTNSVSTSPVSKNIPSLRYLSYRLTMERRGENWLITRMNAITKLDLTPQL